MKHLGIAVLMFVASVSLHSAQVVKANVIPDNPLKQGVPSEINYQGWLGSATDTTAITDVLSMIFRLYTTSTGGTPIWNETHIAIPVAKGIFNVILGSETPLPANIFTGDPLWLETQVMNDTLSPRKKLVSVGYAIKAEKADTAAYAVASAGDNDWIISGNDMYSGVSGNVGIGIISPSFKLDVEGGARFWNSTGGRSGVQIGTIAGSGTGIEGIASDGNLIQPMYINYNSSGDVILAYGGGNVSIGTTTPTSKLTIDTDGLGGDEARRMIKLIPGGSQGRVYIASSVDYLDFLKTDANESFLDYLNISAKDGDFSGNLNVSGDASITGNLTANGVSMGKIYLTGNGTILSTTGGTRVLLWDETNGEIEITNTSGDWCDCWWQAQKGATTSGGSSATANGTSNVAIITGTNTNDYGFEIHFGQADGTNGWCSVWLQYANGAMVGHYIKY
jgi:hypothetical protein